MDEAEKTECCDEGSSGVFPGSGLKPRTGLGQARKALGKLWKMPWGANAEVDLKTAIVTKRDGKQYDLRDGIHYLGPEFKIERENNPEFNTKVCQPTPIYDETGCVIVDYELPIFAEGELAYWESTERYPYDVDCNGRFLWKELAGQKIRHIKMPDESVIPHYISFQMEFQANMM